MKTIKTREVTKAKDNPAEEVVYDGEEKVADEDEASWRRMMLTEK